MRALRRIAWEYEGLKFLIRNLRAANLLNSFESEWRGGYFFATCNLKHIATINELHISLRDGVRLNYWRRLLYSFCGDKFMPILLDGEGAPIGFEMFYFREDELRNKTLHEAFIGISASHRGKGLASMLREYSIDNFKNSSVRRISTNIPRNNISSLKSALKVGFHISDQESTPESYYLYRELCEQ